MSDIVMRINRGSIRLVLAGTVPTNGNGASFPTTQLTTLAPTSRIYGQDGGNDRYWTLQQEIKFLSGDSDLFDQWLDETTFYGFGLSLIRYQQDGWMFLSGGANFNYFGHGYYSTAGPTYSSAADSVFGIHVTATGAGANTIYAVSRYSNVFFRGASANGTCGWYSITPLKINGSNWAQSGASTGARIFCGFTSSTSTVYNSDSLATLHTSGFSRLHVNGGVQDTNWYFVTSDGVTQVRTDSTVAFTAGGNIVVLEQMCAPAGSTIYWRIRDITAGTTSGIKSNASNLPGTTTSMAHTTGWRNIDAVSRSMGWQMTMNNTKRFYI